MCKHSPLTRRRDGQLEANKSRGGGLGGSVGPEGIAKSRGVGGSVESFSNSGQQGLLGEGGRGRKREVVKLGCSGLGR